MGSRPKSQGSDWRSDRNGQYGVFETSVARPHLFDDGGVKNYLSCSSARAIKASVMTV